MAEFNEAQIVKTYRDDEFKIKLVDGQSGSTATDFVTVGQDGDTITPGTNDFAVPVFFKTDEATPSLVIPRTDPDGNVKVVVVPSSDSDKNFSYHLHDSMAKDATDAHDAVVTNAKTAKEIKVTLSSLSLVTWEIGEYNGVDTLTTWGKVVTSPASPVVELNFPMCEVVGDGTVGIQVLATNRDRANDGYSTIQYIEETT